MENESIYAATAIVKLSDKSLIMLNRSIYTVIESALLIDKSSDMENESKVKSIKRASPLLKSDLPVNIGTRPASIFKKLKT